MHCYATEWKACLHICIHTRALEVVMRTTDAHMVTLVVMHTMVLAYNIIGRMPFFKTN